MPPVSVATSAPTATGPVHFLNIEYFFYLLYTWLFGPHSVAAGTSGPTFAFVGPLIASVWVGMTIIGYFVSLGFLALFIYAYTRAAQVADEDAVRYATISDGHAAEATTEHHRWNHVRELIESASESDWREAIIEADIILDDMLLRLGYVGDTVGDKLKTVDPARFATLDQAWDAHRIRNALAHQGSSFQLTDQIAYRTILEYENVFKEHGEI